MSNQRITQAEYARSIGISKQALGRLVKRGKITLLDGKIDPVFADAEMKLLDPAKSKAAQLRSDRAAGILPAVETTEASPPAADAAEGDELLLSYNDARRLRENYEARTKRLEYEQRIGQLVPAAEVEKMLTLQAVAVRASVLGVKARVMMEFGAGLADDSQQQALEAVLRDNLDDALRTVAAVADGASDVSEAA